MTNDIPSGYGTLLLMAGAGFNQAADANPAEAPAPSSSLSAELTSPTAFVISNALLANTRGFSLALGPRPDGSLGSSTNFASESSLFGAATPGAWNVPFQLVFGNGETFVGFSVFQVASNTAPVPRIANFGAAQSIDSQVPFQLDWIPWLGNSPQDRIALVIADSAGKTVVSAATDCSGQTALPVGATGFTIPQGRLAPNADYVGYLHFGANLVSARDDGALLLQRGFHTRTTRFPLRTRPSGGGGGQLGNLSGPKISATSVSFTLSGTPGTTYAIQSSPDLANWTEQSRTTLPANGAAEVTLPIPQTGLPRFFRAVALGGSTTPGKGPSLAITPSGSNRMRITITGESGSSHLIQATTNFVSWTDLGTLSILEGSTSVVFTASVPAGSVSTIYRAIAASSAPPPPPSSGNRPTLSAVVSTAGVELRLSGGDPSRTYSIRQADSTLSRWTLDAGSISTASDGTGKTTIPIVANSSGLFRAEAR